MYVKICIKIKSLIIIINKSLIVKKYNFEKIFDYKFYTGQKLIFSIADVCFLGPKWHKKKY